MAGSRNRVWFTALPIGLGFPLRIGVPETSSAGFGLGSHTRCPALWGRHGPLLTLGGGALRGIALSFPAGAGPVVGLVGVGAFPAGAGPVAGLVGEGEEL